MRLAPICLALLGCGPRAVDSVLPATGAPQTDGEMTVRCSEQPDNRLRWDCAITTTTPGPIEITWEAAEDGAVRGLTSEGIGTEHAVVITGLKPNWSYTARFEGADGAKTRRFTVGPLPSSIQSDVTVTGAGSTPILVELPCIGERALAIADVDGAFLWYQRYGIGSTNPVEGGYEFTRDGTVLAAFADTITETTLAGEEILRLERGVDFPDHPLHHDVHRGANGLTYALFAEVVDAPDGAYVLDGIFVFDGDQLIATWHLADHITPSGGLPGGFWNQVFPGTIDYSHANSVTVQADGSMFVSLRWLSTGMKIDGDPGSPSFGDIAWQVVGDPTSPLTSDFAIGSSIGASPDFLGQHHFNPTPDGRMALFDNRKFGSSRAVILDLDPDLWTADIQESWDIGWICTAQGANHVLDNGHALATCGPAGYVAEFAPGNPDPVWTFDLDCGQFTMVPRGVPAPI